LPRDATTIRAPTWRTCARRPWSSIEASLDAPEPKPVTMDQFKRAMKDVRPSIRPWLETAKNYALFANDGGAYDDLLEYLRARKVL
jgi:hypothetical protein